MCSLVGRKSCANEAIISDRHDNNAAADANETGEQSGAGTRYQSKADQRERAPEAPLRGLQSSAC
jgi:hypothetical protein